MHQEL